MPYSTVSGHIFILPGDDCDDILDYILNIDYNEEFVIADCFEPSFLASLMYAGFLVMSIKVEDEEAEGGNDKVTVLLPKHHITRTILFFDKLHIGRTIKKHLSREGARYKLCAGRDSDYEQIVRNCVKTHGSDWLTEELLLAMEQLQHEKNSTAVPYSFSLYEDGKLVAGEFGIICGRVYTSYSGYYEKSNCGRVQMILTAEYLRNNNFAFWDLGMPLPYKYTLGAQDINIREFIPLFREARTK